MSYAIPLMLRVVSDLCKWNTSRNVRASLHAAAVVKLYLVFPVLIPLVLLSLRYIIIIIRITMNVQYISVFISFSENQFYINV